MEEELDAILSECLLDFKNFNLPLASSKSSEWKNLTPTMNYPLPWTQQKYYVCSCIFCSVWLFSSGVWFPGSNVIIIHCDSYITIGASNLTDTHVRMFQ